MRWSFVDAHFDNQFTVLQLVHILASYLNVHRKKNVQKRGIIGWKPQWIPWFCLKDRRIDLGALQGGRNFVSPEIPPGIPPLMFVFLGGDIWDVWHSPFWDVVLVEVMDEVVFFHDMVNL